MGTTTLRAERLDEARSAPTPKPPAQRAGAGRLLDLQRLAGNAAVAAIVQRSTDRVSMPGLGGDGAGSRKRGREEKQPPPAPEKRVTRAAARGPVDMTRPVLEVTARREGVATQKLDAGQDVGFHLVATLTRPDRAVTSAATAYAFCQQVRDGFASHPAAATDEDHRAGPFVQDGPYHRPYDHETITTTARAIRFDDHPGFTTVSRIEAGKWLAWYEGQFRWTVGDGEGRSWTSPTVTLRIDSPYAGGADAPVTYTINPAADNVWQVQLA